MSVESSADVGPSQPTRRVRRRRWPWITLGGLVAVVLLAAALAPTLLDVERYRGRIEQELRQATGWEPELGAIGFSVLRGLALTVSPARLSAPDGASELEIASLQIRADLWPLLGGRLQVRRIELLRPRIDLVRPDATRGWVVPAGTAPAGSDRSAAAPPPVATGPAGETEPAETPASSGMTVSIEEVEITGGLLRLEDRAVEPPLVLGIEDLDARVYPERSELWLSGRLLEGRGRLEATGSWVEGLRVELQDVSTESLQPFLGPDLLQPGGSLSGTMDVKLPLEIDGHLEGHKLLLLAGEQPLDDAELDFKVVLADGELRLERAELRSAGVRLDARGRLTPDLDLDLEVPEAPIESVAQAARAVFPVPLELEPPGTARATIALEMPEGGELRYSARGELSAAGLSVAEFLPPAKDVRSTFELSPRGALDVSILGARVADGLLQGNAHLDSVYPLGTLTLEGQLAEAVLGQLLDGFVAGAAGKITGPSGLDARIRLDLGRETLDVSALGGNLRLAAREVGIPGWDIESAILRQVGEKLAGLTSLAAALGSDKLDKLEQLQRSAGERGAAGVVERLFDEMSADVDFDSLPWSIRRLGLAGGGLSADGSGTFDPLQGGVDMTLVARFDERKTAELVERFSSLDLLVGSDGRLTVPLRIRGSLMSPEIRADLDQMLKNKLGPEKPEDKVKGLLKGLLEKELSQDQ